MSDISSQELNPSAPLATEDLVRLMFEFVNQQIVQNMKHCNEQIDEGLKAIPALYVASRSFPLQFYSHI